MVSQGNANLVPIPDRLVVLTFDDGVKSHAIFVAPLLKRYGFGATFFVTEAFRSPIDKEGYLSWQEVRELHEDGFEIGNHTYHHRNVQQQSRVELIADLDHIDLCCQEFTIPTPRTFCYPGYHTSAEAVSVLAEKGFLFGRRGVAPEYPYHLDGGRGPAYDPLTHHPLLIPTTGASGPNWAFGDLVWAVEQASNGKIAVLTFHGVPDLDHPWVHTEPATFETYMAYLRDRNCTVIALRDLSLYVDPTLDAPDQH